MGPKNGVSPQFTRGYILGSVPKAKIMLGAMSGGVARAFFPLDTHHLSTQFFSFNNYFAKRIKLNVHRLNVQKLCARTGTSVQMQSWPLQKAGPADLGLHLRAHPNLCCG